MNEGIFSNHWWATVANDYSATTLFVISVIVACLKTWAIMHPSVKNNSIVCLWSGLLFGFPGVKKEEDKKTAETQ